MLQGDVGSILLLSTIAALWWVSLWYLTEDAIDCIAGPRKNIRRLLHVAILVLIAVTLSRNPEILARL